MAAKLHLAAPDEKKKPPRQLTVVQAATDGTVREQLVALRERVAKTIDDPDCPPAALSALTRRLMDCTREIAAIDALEAEGRDEGEATPDDTWAAV